MTSCLYIIPLHYIHYIIPIYKKVWLSAHLWSICIVLHHRGPERETEMCLAQNQLMCNLFHSAQSWHWLCRSRKTSLYPFKLTESSNKDKHWMHVVATDTAGEEGGRETARDTALLWVPLVNHSEDRRRATLLDRGIEDK